VFFFFGLRSKDSRVGAHVMPCEICGVTAAQTLIKRTTKFSLFFVPLFPVKPAKHYVQCAHCGSVRSADARFVAAIAG